MNESIGARLKQARELRRLTIQQVSETTKVRPHYLQALENDDLSAISSVAQARGFLRIYAEFLGLSPADLVPAAKPVDTKPAFTTANNPATSSKENALTVEPVRPGFLTNILNRFRRPVDTETASVQATEPVPVAEASVSEQKPFVPAHIKEEMPEISVPEVVSNPPETGSEPAGQIPIKTATAKTKPPKKVPAKPRKSSAQVGEKSDVKKKVGG
jgi:transcriptional regulator with XRE-family HTH domain